jgi:uncharacterized protein YjiS (DUF1127 family)
MKGNAMTASSDLETLRHQPSRPARLARWLAGFVEGWRERAQLRREFARLAQQGELDRTLADSGIAHSDVLRLMHAHPGTPQQLRRMMARLGIDRAALPRSKAVADAIREMEWRCGECSDWRHCRAWLESGASAESYRTFCRNAAELDRLRCREVETSAGEPPHRCGLLAELEATKGEQRC